MMRRWLTSGLASLLALALVLGLALLMGRGGAVQIKHPGPEAVPITAFPIPHFKADDPAQQRFGLLDYIGGIELRGAHANFGGISAIRLRPDGQNFLAVTDNGDWITGRILSNNGKPVGLADVTIAPVIGPDGLPAKEQGLWDVESLTIDGDQVFIGIERQHSILAFDARETILGAVGKHVPVPDHVQNWPENKGIEALGILPKQSPYAGRLIGLSERSHWRGETTEGFVMHRDGSQPFRFLLTRRDNFDVTDLDFLPSGDLIVLERTFSPLRGVAMRLRRIKIAAIRPDAIVDGETLLMADRSYQIDNMEGLSIHRNGAGETIFTLVSDDNFSVAQRNLLLQFRWNGD